MQVPGIGALSDELTRDLQAALQHRGSDYQPRTRHKSPDGRPDYTNRLIHSSSPYLLQHAHNPVSWWSWGDEAFQEAQRRDVPVLLSVGYSTCHWCHVMEEESFEDLAIAAFMNAHFVPIKVDREERPDVDGIYMTAVQLLTGHGGWPMTVALTPEREPFFGGTYFPPFDGARGARMGFHTVLQRLSTGYREDRGRVLTAARDLSAAIRESALPQAAEGVPPEKVVAEAVQTLARRFDEVHGGFGDAPKFPRPSVFTLLLRHARRTAEPSTLHMVTHTLERMNRGGIHDQLAGGFHRYSTDALWLVPHFEKMLYDNAQLIVSYLHAWQASGQQTLRETARRTLDYVEREMTDPHGAFWSATDADSEGAEGLFFTWTEGELDACLSFDDAAFAKWCYGTRRDGHFEGRSVLHRPRTDAESAAQLGLDAAEFARKRSIIDAQLLAVRARRPPPLLDDKVILEWNAQMISAFAVAARVLDDPHFAVVAARAARWLLSTLRDPDGRLLRTYKEGKARHAGVLEDHAFLVAALLDLVEATGEPEWIERAIEVQALQDRYYLDTDSGGYFTAASDVPGLLVREKPTHDGAQPAGGSIAALNLLRLAELTSDAAYRRRAEDTLRALAPTLGRGALAAPMLAAALDHFHDDPPVIVLLTPEGHEDGALRRVLSRRYLGPGIVLPVKPGVAQARLAQSIPLVADKRVIDGRPTAYVCTHGVCQLPTTDPAVLDAQLAPSAR